MPAPPPARSPRAPTAPPVPPLVGPPPEKTRFRFAPQSHLPCRFPPPRPLLGPAPFPTRTPRCAPTLGAAEQSRVFRLQSLLTGLLGSISIFATSSASCGPRVFSCVTTKCGAAARVCMCMCACVWLVTCAACLLALWAPCLPVQPLWYF
eukprot:Gregarina_sp_Pseudo_9__551@NODE_1354_length_1666_cov_105_838967_g1265_i0_p3_GENE_NODE_1354_length_1666_cov_105_838967_g1265_i0NODE_1354_length_1666_cov_105_838967_g1265_i0_p3_ORF_typecomplete_len150_score3_50ATG22/PF11700_8/0_03_NODE_1354_length_1666_cov_105_838967_g1265_i0370819